MALVTRHSRHTIQSFVDLYRQGRLNLAPAFQRQSVWRPSARQLLIESLLDGIPVPSIYLYQRIGRGGRPIYDVIDGKQRLESILLFLNRGPLAATDELLIKRAWKADSAPEWWGWTDLPKAMKARLLTVELPTIEVEGDLSEIIDLFVRINSTGTRLTAQERRHARFFSSPVLRVAQGLADEYEPYLIRHRVLARSQIQRMKHVELMTELLLGINGGVHLNKKRKIDEIIRGDGLGADDLREAVADLRRALAIVEVILPDLRTTRFRQLADFYSLAVLLHRYRDEGRAVTAHDSQRNSFGGGLLRDFGRAVDEVTDQVRRGAGATRLQEPFLAYLMTVREGTDTAAHRKAREALLRDVLDGVFEDRDPNRTFNAVQRRILWHASVRKRCSICGQDIARWEDVSIDHRKAHVRGGKTNLANAALAHIRCNSAKGAGPSVKARRASRIQVAATRR